MKKKLLALCLSVLLVMLTVIPVLNGIVFAEQEDAPIFTVTNSLSDVLDVAWVSYSNTDIVDTGVSLHNPDGKSYSFGLLETQSATWPELYFQGKFDTFSDQNLLADAKAIVIVISSDSGNKSDYPVAIYKANNCNLPLGDTYNVVQVGADGSTNVYKDLPYTNANAKYLYAGTVNYFILPLTDNANLADGYDITNQLNITGQLPGNASAYDGCMFYLDSVGFTTDLDGINKKIEEAYKPTISLAVESYSEYALLSWEWLKEGIEAQNYRVNLYGENGELIGAQTTDNMRTGIFLEKSSSYSVKIEALDSLGNVVAQSLTTSFETSEFRLPYTVTNSMATVESAIQWRSDNVADKISAVTEQPSKYHPDGKYTAIELNGSTAMEVWTYTGFNSLNASNAEAVIYTISGGSDLSRPEGSQPLGFYWSGGEIRNNAEEVWEISINTKTGKRTITKLVSDSGSVSDYIVTVEANTVNYVIIKLKEDADASLFDVDAHLWNFERCDGYKGTIYIDDYGITENVTDTISYLMKETSNAVNGETGNLLISSEIQGSFADITITPDAALSSVASYNINLYTFENYNEFKTVNTVKTRELTARLNLKPNTVYAVQAEALNKDGEKIAVSQLYGFTSADTDIKVSAMPEVTKAEISWSYHESLDMGDKFDIHWYPIENGTVGEMEGKITVNNTNTAVITGLFPEKQYFVEVYGYYTNGLRNDFCGTVEMIMNTALKLSLSAMDTEITADFEVSPQLDKARKFKLVLWQYDKIGNVKELKTEITENLNFTFKNLNPAEEYGVDLFALDKDGNEITYATTKTITTRIYLTLECAADLTTLNFSWTPDQSISGIESYAFTLYDRAADGTLTVKEKIEISETEKLYTSLESGMRYAAQVTALDKNGKTIAISNLLLTATKAESKYTVTNDMSDQYSTYYSGYNEGGYIKNDVSKNHPDGNYAYFGTGIDKIGQFWPYYEVNTQYTPEDAAKIDAMVFTLESEETNTTDYPIWLNILDNEDDLFDVTVITVTKEGKATRSKWEMGVDKYFKSGSINYIIVDAKDNFDWNNAHRIRFGSGYTQHYYPDCTYYFDDLGYTEDTIALMMELLNVPEYHFYPLESTGNPEITVECESSWAEFEWNDLQSAEKYVLNLYTKTSVGYMLFDSVQTTELKRTINTLSAVTEYVAQVLALDTNGNIIAASDVTEFKTTDRNSPEYLKGPLTPTKGYYPNAVWLYDSNIEVYWNHIEGVTYYIVALYKEIDGKYVYVDHLAADSECFVEFYGMDSTDYYAQVILYDVSDMVVMAFELMQPTFLPVVEEESFEPEEETTEPEEEPTESEVESTESEEEPTKPMEEPEEIPSEPEDNTSEPEEDESEWLEDMEDESSDEDDSSQSEETTSEEESEEEESEENTTKPKKKKYKKLIKYQPGYDYTIWVIFGIVGGVILVATAIVAIILIKKRKKKIQK